MKRFLVVQLRAIGDVILATALPRIIKEQVPGAYVGFLTEAPSNGLLENNPNIDEIFVHKRKDKFLSELKFALKLRSRKFDAVVDPFSNPTSAIFSFATGARRRIGFATAHRNIFFTEVLKRPSGYVVEDKKELLARLGVQSDWDLPEIYLTPEENAWATTQREEITSRLGGRGFYTLDPTHKHYYRQWNLEQYGNLCRMLFEKYGAVGVILRGPGQHEEAEAKAVQGYAPGCVALSPSTSLRSAAALIDAADFHLGNCSAPRHMAVALGTPSFTISGNSQTSWLHPAPHHKDDPFIPECAGCTEACHENHTLRCMNERTAEQVWPHVAQWAERHVYNQSP